MLLIHNKYRWVASREDSGVSRQIQTFVLIFLQSSFSIFDLQVIWK